MYVTNRQKRYLAQANKYFFKIISRWVNDYVISGVSFQRANEFSSLSQASYTKSIGMCSILMQLLLLLLLFLLLCQILFFVCVGLVINNTFEKMTCYCLWHNILNDCSRERLIYYFHMTLMYARWTITLTPRKKLHKTQMNIQIIGNREYLISNTCVCVCLFYLSAHFACRVINSVW